MKANLVEHPGEIHDAASPVVGAPGNGVLSRCVHGASETERKLLAVLRKSNPLTLATLDPLTLHPSASRARKAFRPLPAWPVPACAPAAGFDLWGSKSALRDDRVLNNSRSTT